MPYEPVIDFDQLLAPIPGDNPSGDNLIYRQEFDDLKQARTADDPDKYHGDARGMKQADWPKVLDLATEALAAKSKDLQIAAWLTEALVGIHGFAGLHDGLRLIRGLLEGFWDTLYPEIEDGDLLGRANAIDSLNRPSFLLAVQKAPITNGKKAFRYSYFDWKLSSAGAEGQLPDGESTGGAGVERRISAQEWAEAQAASNRAYYEDLFRFMNRCRDECKALDEVMDQKFGRHTPGLNGLKKGFEEIRVFVEKIVDEKRILEPDAAADSGEGAAEQAGAAAGRPGITAGPIRSRREALRRLAEVADFFQATEPHSPVAYLLRRSINWGNMSLENWLVDVVKNAQVLDELRETLGIKAKE